MSEHPPTSIGIYPERQDDESVPVSLRSTVFNQQKNPISFTIR